MYSGRIGAIVACGCRDDGLGGGTFAVAARDGDLEPFCPVIGGGRAAGGGGGGAVVELVAGVRNMAGGGA